MTRIPMAPWTRDYLALGVLLVSLGSYSILSGNENDLLSSAMAIAAIVLVRNVTIDRLDAIL